MHRTRGLVMVAMLVATGCGGDDASCPLVEDGAATASQLIGPSGGTLELANGGKVEIPAGALDEETMITVTEVLDPKPLPLGLDSAGKGYAFEPHGTVFSAPVKIAIPFSDDDATAVRPMKLDDNEDTSWQTVVGGTKTADKIEMETTSFSIYMAVRARRGSGVILLPDGAVVLPGVDASVGDDAAMGLDAATQADAAVDSDAAADGGLDGSVLPDGGACDPLTEVCAPGEITQLVAGSTHVCALYDSGYVYCWGASNSGESGQGAQVSIARPAPVQLYTGVNLTDAIDISTNPRGTHTCAARSNGTVVCWGDNSDGRCGTDAPNPALRAYAVPGITGAIQVSAGTSHSCAVLTGGEVYCWGSNASGQLVMGSTTPASSAAPLQMVEFDLSGGQQPIEDAIDVAAGQNHTCVLHSGRQRVSCGGSNSTGGGHQGILGRGAIGGGYFPTADEATLPQGTMVRSLHMGSSFYASPTCVIPMTGRPLCWGYNGGYALAPSGTLSLLVPTALDPYYEMPQAIAIGNEFTCVSYVHPNFGPRVACQGYDSAGQLGDGVIEGSSDSVPNDVQTALDPVTYLDGADVELMAAGNNFVCIKLVGGGVTCWGGNNYEVRGAAGTTQAYCDVANVVPGLP